MNEPHELGETFFALMNIAVFDAKYAYNFWRPVTAIRAADTDGNDAFWIFSGRRAFGRGI